MDLGAQNGGIGTPLTDGECIADKEEYKNGRANTYIGIQHISWPRTISLETILNLYNFFESFSSATNTKSRRVSIMKRINQDTIMITFVKMKKNFFLEARRVT